VNISILDAVADLAAAVAPLVLLVAAVCAVGPLLDLAVTRRKLRASKVARPVTGEHYAHDYLVARALDRGVQLVVTHA
jgi:hypothetical protein